MKTPLLTMIVPPSLRYFGDDAAIIESAPATSEGDANADIMSFEAPEINMDAINGVAAPEVTSPVAKPEDKAKPVTPPVKPVDPPKAGEPPAKQLRAELDSVKTERDELKSRLEKGDPRLLEAEKAVKEKEAEITRYKEQTAEYERKLAMADPTVTAKLRDMDSAYDKEAGKFFASVPEIDSRTISDLVTEYHGLPVGTPGYKEARLAFEAKVNEVLGGAEGMDHRKLGRTLDWIEKTHEFALERPKVQQEINASAMKLHRESQAQGYTKQKEFVSTHIEKAKAIPDAMKTTDPYHPRIMIDAYAKGLPAEEVEKFNKGIPEFIELVMAGAPPRSDADYAGMTPEAIRESQARETEKFEQARGNAVDVMYNGLRALRLFPTLAKEVQRLREKLGETNAAVPPDPTRPNGDANSQGGDDIREFKAPVIPNF